MHLHEKSLSWPVSISTYYGLSLQIVPDAVRFSPFLTLSLSLEPLTGAISSLIVQTLYFFKRRGDWPSLPIL